MTVFKTLINIIKKNIGIIILYTVILVTFGSMNMLSSDNTMTGYIAEKPDIAIFNYDGDNKITNNLINYLNENSNIKTIKQDKIDDAIFYRDVNFVIYIPKDYGKNVINNINPTIETKATGDYQSSLANMLLTRYIKTQNIYVNNIKNENILIEKVNNTLSDTAEVLVQNKLDASKMANLKNFFNFSSYSIMATVIFIICLILNSFKENTINKRIIVSSMNYKKHNRLILYGSLVYAIIVWLIYSILSILIVGNVMFSLRGLIEILNLLLFTICSLTISLFISSLVNNKNAINGIVNVVALGSAFLCGAFVPVELLPDTVLKIAHILPAYWFINSNELLSKIEVVDMSNLNQIFFNSFILITFSVVFIILKNIVTKNKLKRG